ncbi:LysR substrate-binding domain-containing protein [Bacteroides caecigallinarum]|uniref:LysR family transcriptional regulator n=2 Tax=Bacteroidaceae TaxID=815 RepID=A0A948TB23_9BACT|nr:LysR substrate-binding domain-containing protein [Bacteroides caecigallinarum]MBM6882196.1 LysR family transcriptional regulator [Bacteroides caecigallinarum]MBM6889186.1 LysR family transcriptional regulator [Bacteroides caecigallinarum]MBU3837756.1 LysR family transcriptional regulator [Candidatus Phocaeicola faecigallinarum]MCF2550974.1 LysR family transcriptional regulator [Bacteroides caecigallinarum]
MELRQLKYFEKACELKNFSEASRMLHISQSTLSQQIKQLEDELNVLLFDRIGKRIIPTEAGLAFLPFARNSILEAENGKQIIKDLKGIMTGTLNIGVTYSLSHLLTCSITEFKKTYPGIKVIINFGTSKEQIKLLEEKLVDCVLSFEPEEIDEEYDKIKLFSSRLYFIVHESSPLAHLSSISLKRLQNIELILPAVGFATRMKTDEICCNNNITLNTVMEINDVQTIINLIRKGNWGTILTKAAIKDEPDLKAIPILSAEILTSQAYLFWPKGSYRKKSAIEFAEFVQKAVRNG